MRLSVIVYSVFLIALGLAPITHAQSTPPPEAQELLSTLQDARSITHVGVSLHDYMRIAQNVKIKLDRFLRSPFARDYIAGQSLKQSAEAYSLVLPNGIIQKTWAVGELALEMTEDCLNGQEKRCVSIALYDFQKTMKDSKDVKSLP